MFERINLLITTHGFGLQSWDDRYGKGIWACLAPNVFLLDEIKKYTEDGDTDMINASDYIETTNWLPFVTGGNFIKALNTLEEFLATLPQEILSYDSVWSFSINQSLENLIEMRMTGQFNLYAPLPKTFVDLIANPII